MEDDDGLMMLNLAEPPAARPQSSRRPKARSWAEKKNANKHRQQGGGPSRGRPFPQGARLAVSPPPHPAQPGNLLKGYALEAPPSPPPQPIEHTYQPRRPQQQQPELRAPSPPPPPPPTEREAPPAAKRTKRPHDAHVALKVGRLRMASRLAGDREATPDQDDIIAASEDEGDVLAAVTAAVTRDRALEEELAQGRKERGEEGPGPSDDEIDNEYYSGDVVDFTGGMSSAYPRLQDPSERRKRKKREGKGSALAVRPGELTHAGAGPSSAPFLEGNGDEAAGETSFEGLGLFPALAARLSTLGFAAPTTVQRQAVPVLLSNRDALVKAPTGSGKTLAYLAPIMHDLAQLTPHVSRADGTLALVICPTRELCLQVVDTLTLLARGFVWVVPGATHGGENRAKEKARLRKGVTVLVATPGRLLDHLENTASFRIDGLRWLVLDEADRLMDLGFEKKIAHVVELLDERARESSLTVSHPAAERRSVLLSATLHSGLAGLAGLSLRDPVAVGWALKKSSDGGILLEERPEAKFSLKNGGAGANAAYPAFDIPAQLKQRYLEVPCKLRLVALGATIKARVDAAPDKAKLVVFFSNCDSVEFYHAMFERAWLEAAGAPLLPPTAPLLKLHGNMQQSDRTAALLRFTKATAGVLLCTDVAARGLDFPAVSTIIQYDPAGAAEEYVHRVGRTARLGHSGEALVFLQPTEMGYVEHLRSQGVVVSPENVAIALDRALGVDLRAGKAGCGVPVERHHAAFRAQRQLMDVVEQEPELMVLAEGAFRSYVRAYATHSLELKPFFAIKTLHLGHVAHSFALKEGPTMVGRSSIKEHAKRRQEEQARGRGGGKKKPPQGYKRGFSAVSAKGGGGYVLS